MATASTLFRRGATNIDSAAQAARAPMTGTAAGLLFALGVIGVGFLAVPGWPAGRLTICQTIG